MNYVNFNYRKFKTDHLNLGLKSKELSELALNIPGMSYDVIKNIENGRRKVTEEEVKLLCEIAGLKYQNYINVKRPVVITFAANKGGAGKTTDVVNIAGSLVLDYGKKVLVIDTDLQQNATLHLGMLIPHEIEDQDEVQRINKITRWGEKHNIYEAFIKRDDLSNYIIHTEIENLDIVLSSDAMSRIEQDMPNIQLREFRMKNILEKILTENPNGYDFILFDCNSLLGKFNESVLFASDYLIIPMEASSFGLRGVQYIVNFYNDVRSQQESLSLLGIILNKYNKQKNISKDVMEALSSSNLLSALLFETKIPVDTSIEQAQAYGEVIQTSFSKSKAAIAFKEITREILERVESQEE